MKHDPGIADCNEYCNETRVLPRERGTVLPGVQGCQHGTEWGAE